MKLHDRDSAPQVVKTVTSLKPDARYWCRQEDIVSRRVKLEQQIGNNTVTSHSFRDFRETVGKWSIEIDWDRWEDKSAPFTKHFPEGAHFVVVQFESFISYGNDKARQAAEKTKTYLKDKYETTKWFYLWYELDIGLNEKEDYILFVSDEKRNNWLASGAMYWTLACLGLHWFHLRWLQLVTVRLEGTYEVIKRLYVDD
jgi:hypothetical protein